MKSNVRLAGSEFAARVSGSAGQDLRFGKWVALMYDVLLARDEFRTFEDLAFEAKSFQKLTRLLSTEVLDNSARDKVEAESKGAFERFIALLERATSSLQSHEREELGKQFLNPSSSAGDVMALLDDFSKIKDFYLREHD